jgi:DNA primase
VADTTRPDRRAIAELRDRAAAQVVTLVTGEDWEAWLRLAARFPAQGFKNLLLIAAQRPAATVVAGYDEWHTYGRQVRKGEPGIRLIAEPAAQPGVPATSPATARADRREPRGKRGSQAQLTYVWDISQTNALPGTKQTKESPAKGVTAELWDALTWLARREGFAVDRTGGDLAAGQTNWATRRIWIPRDLGPPMNAWALIHELGHVLAHGDLADVPGTTTARCIGARRVHAESITFIVAARLGLDTSSCSWPSVASWAGSDPRAQPQKTIHAVGECIVRAASAISAHLDVALFATPRPDDVAVLSEQSVPTERAVPGEHRCSAQAAATATSRGGQARDRAVEPTVRSGPPPAALARVLLEAERFYRAHLSGSWVPEYLESRGMGSAITKRWPIGYAPGGWTILTGHLRRLGYDDALIQAAGLARRSSRGTLIDHFRDRVMLTIRDERGMIAGFIGQASPNAVPAVPKYLNSPETGCYAKGNLLFGLHEARSQLTAGAIPVIVEGPVDAIAVTAAGQQRYAGLAPCGTALTNGQIAALATLAELDRVGVVMALDGDRAGRDGVVKAYQVLLPHTAKTLAAMLPANHDPAEIMQMRGTAALTAVLDHSEPLARVVIDAHLDRWSNQLDHAEGRLAAMRSAAQFVASTLLPETARVIRQITSGQEIETLDENLHHIPHPELPMIARLLPAGAACQIARVADRTGSGCDEVTAEVTNAVSKGHELPKHTTGPLPRADACNQVPAHETASPGTLARHSFPDEPIPAAGPSRVADPKAAESPFRRPALVRYERRGSSPTSPGPAGGSSSPLPSSPGTTRPATSSPPPLATRSCRSGR